MHIYTVSMRKLQILFAEPQLERLRELARRQDRPVSELVRIAVDEFLSRHGSSPDVGATAPPSFRGGPVLVAADRLREAAYDRTGSA